MNEIEFKGSNLEATLKNTNAVEKFYKATESAFEKQPNSKFWKQAYELISKRYKRLKKNDGTNK